MGDSATQISFGAGNTDCGNFDYSHTNNLNDCTIILSASDRKREILKWLSLIESQGGQLNNRHQNVCNGRVNGIGEWLFRTDEFLKWRGGEDGFVNPTLLCCGDPGVGKSYLR